MRIATILTALVMAATMLAPASPAIADDQPASPTWKLTVPPADVWELGGYSVGESIRAGEPLELKLSGDADAVTLEVFRMGHYDGDGALLVATVENLPLTKQADCDLGFNRMVDCSAWQVSHTFDTTGWEPGLYLTKLTDDQGRQRYLATILRSPSHEGRVTIMSATATHAAYNNAGGYSLYVGADGGGGTRAHTVTMERPSRLNGADKILTYELGLIQHLESLGLPLAYTTNAELDRGADTYLGSKALVMLGHDEYWSLGMRENARILRDRGTNLVFLGSNSIYYRIRWNDDHTQVTSYKEKHLDPVQAADTTVPFRAEPFPDPEASLLGSQYDCDGANPQTDLVIVNPDFWAFAGTGVRAGDRLPGLVGHEVDKAVPESPPGTHIASHSTFECTKKTGSSDITYYVAPSGAGVLNLGTMGFAYALTPGINYPAGSIEFARKVVANIAEAAAEGPLGGEHTEVGNFEEIYPWAGDPRTIPGEHEVNGRQWRTTCEPYSHTTRCWAEIWATQVTHANGVFTARNDWFFNNLTYLPEIRRSMWGTNPLANTGSWTAADGRRWRTECNTAATGQGGCRTWIHATVVEAVPTAGGGHRYQMVNKEVFNSMVQFG